MNGETESQVAIGLMLLSLSLVNVVRILYYQAEIRQNRAFWPDVDPMPRLGYFRLKLKESGRPLRSFVTFTRLAIATAVLAICSAFVVIGTLSHPIVAVVFGVSMAFVTGVEIYQWMSADLGLMRAKWPVWPGRARADKQRWGQRLGR